MMLTSWLNLREEGSQFLALDNVSDYMTCDLGICTVSNDHRRPTLKSPESCFHLKVYDEDYRYRYELLKQSHVVNKTVISLRDFATTP